MDILRIALNAGMEVAVNDGVDQKEGRCVVGSLMALQRFADAFHATVERKSRNAHVRDALIDCPAIRSLVESDPLMFV